MTRNDVLWVAIIIVIVLILTAVSAVLIPIWLPVLLVKPSILNPVQEHITQQIMKKAIRSMVRI